MGTNSHANKKWGNFIISYESNKTHTCIFFSVISVLSFQGTFLKSYKLYLLFGGKKHFSLTTENKSNVPPKHPRKKENKFYGNRKNEIHMEERGSKSLNLQVILNRQTKVKKQLQLLTSIFLKLFKKACFIVKCLFIHFLSWGFELWNIPLQFRQLPEPTIIHKVSDIDQRILIPSLTLLYLEFSSYMTLLTSQYHAHIWQEQTLCLYNSCTSCIYLFIYWTASCISVFWCWT